MGIRTDPGYRLYVGEHLCFPASKAPKKLYLTVSDISIGQYWHEGLAPPPNGTYICEWTEFGTWVSSGWPVKAFIYLINNQSLVMIDINYYDHAYSSFQNESCKFSGIATTYPSQPNYHGGCHVITSRD